MIVIFALLHHRKKRSFQFFHRILTDGYQLQSRGALSGNVTLRHFSEIYSETFLKQLEDLAATQVQISRLKKKEKN